MKARWIVSLFAICLLLIVAAYIFISSQPPARIFYLDRSILAASSSAAAIPAPLPVAHIKTPVAVKAVYMTACLASESRLREAVLTTISGTEINSLMIDLKDYTGTIAYASTTLLAPHGTGCRIYDLPAFVAELHSKGVYVIGRITVFQDPVYATAHPADAVQSRSRPGHPWLDRNGLAYVDPDAREYWDRVVAIAKEGYSIGFDEINFDYIRFPSDGDMSDALFALPPVRSASTTPKTAVMDEFFSYLHSKLAPSGIVMSADIFGQTTVNTDDLGIGQILEKVLPYFDYVAPMVYPSHFINGFEGYANPAAYPYEVVKISMTSAVERAAMATTSLEKLRPWLQAFNLGATYTPAMVHAEQKAVYDSGLTSWMLWDAANRYNKEEL